MIPLILDGLILVHKPAQLTSHDVVDSIRNILKIRKVGHFGTLDPWATGLLIIAVGKATRLFPLFLQSSKTYESQIRLGWATDTFDLLGRPTSPQAETFPDKETILQAMKVFRGNILQVPPLYSAKKHKGKPLYVLARKNQTIELEPCPVTVHIFELKFYSPPLLDCVIRCSSGTYIRSLAHDLGQKLGCGAHLVKLVRTSIDPFDLEESRHLEEIQEKAEKDKIVDVIIPMESLLPHIPKIVLTETGSRMARNGNIILPEHILSMYEWPGAKEKPASLGEKLYRLFSEDGRLLAIAKHDIKKKGLHPFLVIDSENISKYSRRAEEKNVT